MVKNNILVDDANTHENEFFRIKQIFDEIALNPEATEVVKLQILMKKADELYRYMQKIGITVAKVNALKYRPGAIEPHLEIMSPDQALKEADRCFTVYFDFESAKSNYIEVINIYKKRLDQFKVYEPYFDHVTMILNRLQPKFKEMKQMQDADIEKKKLGNEISDVRKQNLYLEAEINELKKQISEQNEAWELSVSETFSSIADNFEKWKFVASLPQWKDLEEKDVGTVSKIISYCIIRNKSEITADEIIKELKINDVTALAQLPFIKFIGKSKFKIDYDGLKLHLAKDKKVDFRVDEKNWIVTVKDAFGKYLSKLQKKDKKK